MNAAVGVSLARKFTCFDSEGCYADGDIPDDDEQNSLVTSMNQDMSKVACRRITGVPQAPLVSQMSDNEGRRAREDHQIALG
jgi:hypothetical protein